MVLKKLKSNKGASILIALLLFLVCTVIGSIVLAAATAASGRVSSMEESDRRYYAVTSAAELFREMLNDQELTVTRKSEQSLTYTWNDGETEGAPEPDDPDYTFKVDGSGLTNHALTSESILTEATLDYVLGVNRRTDNDANVLAHVPGSGFTLEKTFTVTPMAPTADDKLVVSVKVEAKNGALLFTFQNDFTDTPNAMKDQKFVLCFTLTPSCSFLSDPRSWTVTGDTKATVQALVDEGGEPLLDEAGLPQTLTKFSRVDTYCVDNSVAVKWTASQIGGAA